MTYKSYIKKDYKVKDAQATERRGSSIQIHFPYLFIAVAFISGMIFLGISHLQPSKSVVSADEVSDTNVELPIAGANEPELTTDYETRAHPSVVDVIDDDAIASSIETEPELEPEPTWQSVEVKSGDSLALIFKRQRLSPKMLYNIMALGDKTAMLKNIKPGQEIRFLFEDGEFEALQYDIDLTDTLYITKLGDIYSAELLEAELETRTKTASGTINDSLFLAGKRAGLSDNMIMQLINLYGWDIDFAMEVRKGDEFHLIYEERYKDGEKVQDGPILAAEFVNRGKPFTSVRYIHADGRADYYAANGDSMRKAFLRTPVKFSRISSRFSLGRKHPILNKIRAHKGVDYAASTGTPVKAAGDGVIKLSARKGGYGKTVIIQHGGKYTTLYGHLSRYGRGIKRGKHVKQGQIIGYVGSTGLATGPHLHYEFRVNGVHRNPLTVKLPKALRIPNELMAEFKSQTEPLLTQLNTITNRANIAEVNNKQQSLASLDQPSTNSDDDNKVSLAPN